jgi:hypothetical protein
VGGDTARAKRAVVSILNQRRDWRDDLLGEASFDESHQIPQSNIYTNPLSL